MPETTKTMTRRAFARLLGVSEGSVRKALKSARIVAEPDGTIDAVTARAAWERSTDFARTKVRTSRGTQSASTQPAVRTPDDAKAAVSLIRSVLASEGADAVGVIDFNMVRVAEGILKSRERDLKMAQRRKELVPLAAVRAHVEKAFIGLRQAIQRMPSRNAAAIAAEVGCDAAALEGAMSRMIAAELTELSAPIVRA